jgi:dTDP-4-dehydrorhamnose reductase
MTWAVVGSNGMFGSDMVRVLSASGAEAVGFNRANLDLTDSVDSLAHALSRSSVVINAVAFTKVDLAESKPRLAEIANSEVPRKLVEACKLTGSRLIQISTDYVFDGESKIPYLPNDVTGPLSVYGKTKLAGENAVLDFENGQVVRTAWLYGANGLCFPRKIATKLIAAKECFVVDDQFGSPTHTWALANFVLQLGKTSKSERILHGVSSGTASWFEFAREIARSMGLQDDLIQPISSVDLKAPAKRPASSVLEPSVIPGYRIPDWLSVWEEAAGVVIGDIRAQ